MPMTLVSCTASVSDHAVQGPTASTSSPVSGSSTPSAVVPLPWTTAISPLSRSWNQRRPILQSGPPNSSFRTAQSLLVGTTAPVTASGLIRWSSHQPPTSETKSSDPSRSHSTWTTDSSMSPTSGRTPVKVPSAVTSAVFTTVPSSGTAAITRRTSVGDSPVNSSSTHHTSPCPSCTCGSTQRSPPPISDTGVSGQGSSGPSG